MNVDPALREGHYAKKQLLCDSRLIAWSHGSRFEAGLRLARELGGLRILDHGCGDGTFLAMLLAESGPGKVAVGAEIYQNLVDDCRSRLSDRGISFVLTDDLDDPSHAGRYDLIVCMEVLEHVPDIDREMDRFERLLDPNGRLLISVPVEIGPALIVKQVMRRVAGWRGLGNYPGTSPYTWRELLASVFAGKTQHIRRPLHRDENGHAFHDHKGFNYRVLEETLRSRFVVENVITSPVGWLPPRLASQVWFIARKGQSDRRAGASRGE